MSGMKAVLFSTAMFVWFGFSFVIEALCIKFLGLKSKAQLTIHAGEKLLWDSLEE
jgi:hypothetical protein